MLAVSKPKTPSVAATLVAARRAGQAKRLLPNHLGSDVEHAPHRPSSVASDILRAHHQIVAVDCVLRILAVPIAEVEPAVNQTAMG